MRVMGFFISLLAATSIAAASEVGRYQLFQGEYEFTNIKGEIFWKRGLFKIDTATGQVFICSSYQFSQESKAFTQVTACRPFEETLP